MLPPCVQAGSGGGWSWGGGWDAAADWGRRTWAAGERRWDEWRQRPGAWLHSAEASADEWRQRAGERLSWKSVEDWQERHWAAFQERQRARLAALTEEERQLWARRLSEGEELMHRELQAFEAWQQRWWAAHHPEERAHRAPASPQFRLTYLFLPLLPHFAESASQFGCRTKASRCAPLGLAAPLLPLACAGLVRAAPGA